MVNDKDIELIIRNQISIVNMLGFIIKELKGQAPILRVKFNDDEYGFVRPNIEAISFREGD